MRKQLFAAFVILLGLCLLPALVHAQAGTAAVTGIVTDTSGAFVPGASVKVVDTRTGTTYFGKTSGEGAYQINDIPPGPGYSITVKKDGFKTFSLSNVYLPVAVTTTENIKLELGSLEQTVTVTATGSVTLDTTDAMIGNNLDQHALESLPSEFRDNPANLLRLEPGVVSAITPAGGPTSGTGSIDPNLTRDGAIAGSRTDQSNIIVDGIDQSNISSGFAFTFTGTIPVDAIQEFNTIIGNPLPQYGGRSGGQTLITTKSGTNSLHGNAYEYNRTAATEADSFFSNLDGIPRLALVRNQFGGNIGGPIWKDKAFFFFEYDGRRDDESASVEETVPMDHVKLGELAYINTSQGQDPMSPCDGARLTSADVSTACVTILPAATIQSMDPCSGLVNCSSLPGFQAAGVDPTLLSLFNTRYPKPNDFSAGDGLNTAGFRFNTPNPLIENDYLARADFNLNSKNKLFARFNFDNITSLVQPNAFPGDPLTSPNLSKDRSWVLSESWTATPNFINQFTYGESRENTGQPILFNPGGSLFELTFDGGTVSNPFIRQTSFATIAPEPTFRDDVTWVRGNHTFAFGGEWNPILFKDGITNDFTFIQQGIGGNISSLDPSETPGDILASDVTNWNGAFVGNLGTIFNVQAAFNFTGKGVPLAQGSPVAHDYRVNALAGYFNDSWRLRPSLTLTLGVRYQYESVPYETHGVQASFLNTNFKSIVQTRIQNGLAGIFGPDATPQLTYSLTGKVNHAPPIYSPEYHDFSPRIGVAWNPSMNGGLLGKLFGDRKTVLRAGGSIIYDDTVINNIVALENQQDYTFGGSFAQNFGVSGDTPTQNLGIEPRFNSITSVAFPVPPPPFVTPITPVAIFNYDVDNQFRTPYSFVTTLSLQRELPWGLQFEADYFGRFSRRMFVLADAAQTMDFTFGGQKMSVAFTNLEKDALANDAPAAVAAQPFFESLFGAGSTQAIYAAFSNQSMGPASTAGSSMAEGNTGLMVLELGLQPANIGLTPQFFVNALATNLGSESYNSMFTTLRKRLSNNLQFDLDYTFSHAMDNNSTVPHANGNFEPGVTTILCDATNAHACRGNSEFDVTHQITGYFVYDLPFGRGQRFAGNAGRLMNEAIGGWQISGTESWRTGLALTADSGISSTTSLAADAGMDFVGQRSALASNIHIDRSSGTPVVQFFQNPAAARAAYTPALGLTVGTRDNLRGPHFSGTDVQVAKTFPLGGERYKLQFQAQAFNVFNHTNFALYDPTINSPSTFGTITSEAGVDPSRVMQFALVFSF